MAKKPKRPSVKKLIADRDMIAQRLTEASKALVGFWVEMKLDKEVSAKDRETVARQAQNYALAARVVAGDIELQVIQLPHPPHFMRPPVGSQPVEPTTPAPESDKDGPGQYL